MNESRPSKSDSHPNTDLMDTNQMPNLKLSAIDISKEPRKPRPLSRSFETFPAESKQDISKSKFEIGIEEHLTETTEADRIVEPLKDRGVDGAQPKRGDTLRSSEKKSYKELTTGFFHFKTKKGKEEEHAEIDGRKDSVKSKRDPSSSTSATILSSETDENIKTKEMIQSPSSNSIKDLTGYRSSKMALNNDSSVNYTGYRSSRMTMTVSAETGMSNTLASRTTYNAMSNFRQSRMSGMLGFNSGQKETEKGNAAQNSKTFKQYFRKLLQEHDNSQRLAIAVNRRPKVFKLSAIFGTRGESTDPMNRLIWMAYYHQELKNNSTFMIRPKETHSVTISRKPEQGRILDVCLEDNPIGIELEKSQLLDLEIVMSGTEKALLDKLMIPLQQDLSYPEVFLASYRFFISPIEVFNSLTEWYNLSAEGSIIPNAKAIFEENEKLIKIRSLRIILLWIRNHWQDFLDHNELWCLLRNFSKFLSKESFSDFQKVMHAIREERLSWMTMQYIPMFPNILEKDSTSFWCPEVDTEKFAHDLTMLDHIFFRKMKPDIYLQMLSKPGPIVSGAFNVPLKCIFDYCNWFQMVACYPSALLAQQENTKKRTMTIRLLIKIAKTCLDLGNLQSSFAIIYGLKLPGALIWYSAWEALPAKSMEYFKGISNLMSCKDNYKSYWEYIQKLEPPAVPYLIPHFLDIVFLSENNLFSTEPSVKLKKPPTKDVQSIQEELLIEDEQSIPEDSKKTSRTSNQEDFEGEVRESLNKSENDTNKEENGTLKLRESQKKYDEEKNAIKADDLPKIEPSKIPSRANRITAFRHSDIKNTLFSIRRENEEKGANGEKKINFQRFYDIFSVVAELERYRFSSYHGILKSEKNSSCALLQHIRFVSKRDDAAIGGQIVFNSGSLPDNNDVLNSEAAIKNIKKIVNLLAEVEA